MEIFADHCVHTEVVEALREFGFKVERAGEVGLEASSDEEVFDYIIKTSQVLLTFDRGFGNILRFNIRRSAGVVIFHLEAYRRRLSREVIIKRVIGFFSRIKQRNLKGRLFVVDIFGRIRIWPKNAGP
jgi:predicted nuclease of predicted toxin-antitoxin system